ncbi:radical SAM protein [Candidatus Micrarchaeota archaeon]|nr:radical SAM protein [Candidatus Micrarchaeota archaeon]
MENPISRELNLFMGYTCNNHCWFCSEEMNKAIPDKTTAMVKEELLTAKKTGVQRITLTGGEPTIRADIFELISYASSLNFEEIFIITNGRMLFYKEFARKLAEAGLTHILFSLHAPRAEIHDSLTQVPGSFEQIVQGIKNMVEVGGVMVDNNTTITKKNYKYLPELAELLVKLGVQYYEFIFINPITVLLYSPDRFEELVPTLRQIEKYLHGALDVGIKKGVWCTAEAIPLCYMQGYEKHVTELGMSPLRMIVGPNNRYTPDLNTARKEKAKTKAEKCKRCKYYLVCEGAFSQYTEHYGMAEFRPVAGEYIKDPNVILDSVKE